MRPTGVYVVFIACIVLGPCIARAAAPAADEQVPGFKYVPTTSFEHEPKMAAAALISLKPRPSDANKCATACLKFSNGKKCRAWSFCVDEAAKAGQCMLFPRPPPSQDPRQQKRPAATTTFTPSCTSGVRLTDAPAAKAAGGAAGAPAKPAPAGAAQPCRSSQLKHTYVEGNDLSSAKAQGASVPTATACCALCGETRGCKSWSWNVGGGKRCYLKHAAQGKDFKQAKGAWAGVMA